MDEKKMDEFREDFALLLESGFVAVKQLDETSATRIFRAAQAIRPSHVAPQIGIGYIHLNKLEVKEATRIFQQVVDGEPENYLAQTFLGICHLLSRTRRKKGEKIIREAMEKTDDPTVRNLGEISLLWAEKDLKKREGSPFLVGASEEGEEVQ